MSELAKSQSYSQAPDVPQETVDRINKRLQGEMRARIRQVAPSPPSSEKWYEVLEHLQHLASVAVMEEFGGDRGLGNVDNNVSGAQSLGKSSDQSTVWERDGLCVRLIVEEGKINLLTRMLADFKRDLVTTNGAAGLDVGVSPQHIRGYEMSLGLLLRCGLSAVEAVQTLDVRALFDHIALSLDSALNPQCPFLIATPDDIFMQENITISYLAFVMEHLSAINEDMAMSNFIDLQILEKVVAHAEKNGAAAIAHFVAERDSRAVSPSVDIPVDHLSQELATAYCKFFTGFFDSDTFKAQMATFFPNRPAKTRFVGIIEPILKTVLTPTPTAEAKKMFRPLSDIVLRFK